MCLTDTSKGGKRWQKALFKEDSLFIKISQFYKVGFTSIDALGKIDNRPRSNRCCADANSVHNLLAQNIMKAHL